MEPLYHYGTLELEISLNLPETFCCTFTIADVGTAVIGIDFLSYLQLMVDTAERSLVKTHFVMPKHPMYVPFKNM